MPTIKSIPGVLKSLILCLCTAFVTGCGHSSTAPTPVVPTDDPPATEIVDIVVTPSLTGPFRGALQSGDADLYGHICYVYGRLSAYVSGSRTISVQGSVTVLESVSDGTKIVSYVSDQVVRLPAGYEIIEVLSGREAIIPPNYSTPTADHALKTIPVTGDLATDIVTQLDRVGPDVGYTGVVEINFEPMTLRVRRPRANA